MIYSTNLEQCIEPNSKPSKIITQKSRKTHTQSPFKGLQSHQKMACPVKLPTFSIFSSPSVDHFGRSSISHGFPIFRHATVCHVFVHQLLCTGAKPVDFPREEGRVIQQLLCHHDALGRVDFQIEHVPSKKNQRLFVCQITKISNMDDIDCVSCKADVC